MLKGSCLCKAVTYTLDEEFIGISFFVTAQFVGKQLPLPIQLMLKLVVKS